MNNDKQQANFQYSIKNIRQVFFFADENLITRPGDIIYSSTSAKVGVNLEKQLLNFNLRVWYHYQDEATELAATEVENIFWINDLGNYIDENTEVNLPANAWINIVGLSISHARALFTNSLARTAYQDVIMSIMQPIETAKAFFPKAFENFPAENKQEEENPITKLFSDSKGETKGTKRKEKSK